MEALIIAAWFKEYMCGETLELGIGDDAERCRLLENADSTTEICMAFLNRFTDYRHQAGIGSTRTGRISST